MVCPRLSVTIPDARVQSSSNQTPFVTFQVQVEGELPESLSFPSQGVWRRYKEFLQLRDDLAEETPSCLLKLPGKELFRSKYDDAVILRRKLALEQGLQRYLEMIALLPADALPSSLVRFLGLVDSRECKGLLNPPANGKDPNRLGSYSSDMPSPRSMNEDHVPSSKYDSFSTTSTTATNSNSPDRSDVSIADGSQSQQDLPWVPEAKALSAVVELDAFEAPNDGVNMADMQLSPRQLDHENQPSEQSANKPYAEEPARQAEEAEVAPAKVESWLSSATHVIALRGAAQELRNMFANWQGKKAGFSNASWATALALIAVSNLSSRRSFRTLLTGVICVVANLLRQRKEAKERSMLIQQAMAFEKEANTVEASVTLPPSVSDQASNIGARAAMAVKWLVQDLGFLKVASNQELPQLTSSVKIETQTNFVANGTDTAQADGVFTFSGKAQEDGSPEPKERAFTFEGPEQSAETGALCEVMDELFNTREHARSLAEAGVNLEDFTFSIDRPKSVLWRISRAAYRLAKTEPYLSNKDLRKPVLNIGVEAATTAAGPGPDDGAIGHKWIAICTMEAASNIMEKVSASHAFQRHAMLAIESGRGDFDPTLHYILGKFRQGILGLSFIERKAAQALYGAPLPKVSWDMAMESFRKAGSLRTTGIAPMDLVEIGYCLKALKRREEARQAWQQALDGQCHCIEDEEAQETSRQMLKT